MFVNKYCSESISFPQSFFFATMQTGTHRTSFHGVSQATLNVASTFVKEAERKAQKFCMQDIGDSINTEMINQIE